VTEAFRCNGCGEYYDAPFRLVSIEAHIDAIDVTDLTLDELKSELYGVLEDDYVADGHDPSGDFCFKCGVDLLGDLVDRFEEGNDGA
jgi:hypothetical protein